MHLKRVVRISSYVQIASRGLPLGLNFKAAWSRKPENKDWISKDSLP